VQKIVQDHGGQIVVERSTSVDPSEARTVFQITIPALAPEDQRHVVDDETATPRFSPVNIERH
jgi:hypothetical protein